VERVLGPRGRCRMRRWSRRRCTRNLGITGRESRAYTSCIFLRSARQEKDCGAPPGCVQCRMENDRLLMRAYAYSKKVIQYMTTEANAASSTDADATRL